MENIIFYKTSEEYKAIKRLEEMTKNYSLNSEDLHYAIILYYLIINLQKENKKLKEVIDKAIEYIRSNDIEVLKYHDIPSETTSYEIVTVDLLKILRGGENNE